MNLRERISTVTMLRWLWAPLALISLEQGHSEVTGTVTARTKSFSTSRVPISRQVYSIRPRARVTGASFSMK
jgi:hypothetical protein